MYGCGFSFVALNLISAFYVLFFCRFFIIFAVWPWRGCFQYRLWCLDIRGGGHVGVVFSEGSSGLCSKYRSGEWWQMILSIRSTANTGQPRQEQWCWWAGDGLYKWKVTDGGLVLKKSKVLIVCLLRMMVIIIILSSWSIPWEFV